MRRFKSKITAEYLRSLIQSPSAFINALKAKPKLIQQQDETGRTLLHYLAQVNEQLGETSLISMWQHCLIAGPKAAIQDKQGNTALHVVAENIDKQFISGWLMPAMMRLFEEQQVAYTIIKNKLGHTFNDLLTQHSEKEYYRVHNETHPLAQLQQQRRRDVTKVITFMKMELLDDNVGVLNENLKKLPATKQLALIQYLSNKFSQENFTSDEILESEISEVDEYGVFQSIEKSIEKTLEDTEIDHDLIVTMNADIVKALAEYATTFKATLITESTPTITDTTPVFSYASNLTATTIFAAPQATMNTPSGNLVPRRPPSPL